MIDFNKYLRISEQWDYPCWRFVELIYWAEFGVRLPTFPLRRSMLNGWRRVPIGEELRADIIILPMSRHTKHAGIILGDKKMISYDGDSGAAVERYTVQPWRIKYNHSSIYRYQPA